MHDRCHQCRKIFKDGDKVIWNNYGDVCSFSCWKSLCEKVVGYDPYNYKKIEIKPKEEVKKPQWGDDL